MQGHYKAWVLPSEMTCHLHILVMSGELTRGVDLYTLIAWVQFSETGTELDIIKWSHVMKSLVCQAQHLELNPLLYGQPMKLIIIRHN